MEFAFIGTHTAADWAEWYRTNAEVTEGDVVVATDPLPSYVGPDRIGDDAYEFAAVDVAVDGCGMVYILAADGDIYRYDPNQEWVARLACVWDPEDDGEPAAIAVTDDSLYIADRGTGRVQALSIHLLQTRWITDTFEDPVGLTTGREAVYVLDAGDPDAAMTSAQGRVVQLGAGGETEMVVQQLYNPIDIASDTAGTVYVLGSRPASDPFIKLFESDTLEDTDETGATADIRVPTEGFTIKGTEKALNPLCLEAIDEGELLVGVGPEAPGEQTLFRYQPSDQAFERLPSYSGSSVALQSGRAARPDEDPPLYVVDGAERAVHRLSPTRQSRRNALTGQYDAQVVRRFDSGERGTEWHRVTMGLELGDSRTQVRLNYAATDDDWRPTGADEDPTASPKTIDGIGEEYGDRLQKAGITDLSDLVEVTPGQLGLILGTEKHTVSLHKAAGLLDKVRSALGGSADVSRIEWRDVGHPNPEDALLDAAEGRFLWVKLELVGNEFSSPRIGHFRAYFPRRSYLRYLPAVYQEDKRSAAFLERYLSLFESTFVDIEEEIGSSSKFLDPEGIPSDHLLWLGSWLAVEADDTWSATATRELIARAPDLYKKRGTAEGLLAMLRIYLGDAATATIGNGGSQPAPHRGCEPLRSERDGSGQTDGDAATSSTAGEGTTGTAETEVRTGRGRGRGRGRGTGTGTGTATEMGETTGNDEEANGSGGDEDDATPAEPQAVYLLEHGDLSCIQTSELGDFYSRLISCPQGFLVLVHPSVDDEYLPTIERIVDTQQPAHATGQTVHLRPWLMLSGDGGEPEAERGFHTYLGINSRLSSREFRIDEAGLGQDTMLVERETYGHLELQSRLGRDARIN